MKITLQQIFDKADLKDFDWRGFKPIKFEFTDNNRIWIITKDNRQFNLGLPDLLANKSLCKAWWGDNGCMQVRPQGWEIHSLKTFKILQHEGAQKCLDYIYKTML